MKTRQQTIAMCAAVMVAAGIAGVSPGSGADAVPTGDFAANPLNKPGYYLTAQDEFNVAGATLTPDLWNTRYLPHWSNVSNEARYSILDGALDLRIDTDTPAWDPKYDGSTKISGIQTAQRDGLHKWNANYPGIDHHEPTAMQHIQRYGYFEIRAKVAKGGGLHSAWWMVGAQQDTVPGNGATTQNSEVDIFEILGRDTARGLFNWHKWNDPAGAEKSTTFGNGADLSSNYHVYGFEWTPTQMKLYLDNQLVQTINGSPNYPMLTLLGIYEKTDAGSWTGPFDPSIPYPKKFSIDYFRAYQKVPVGTYSLEIDDAALYGTARSSGVANATGGRAVTYLGQGPATRAVLDELYAATAGMRTLTLRYASAEVRSVTYRVNQGAPITLSLPGTGGWATFSTVSFSATLNAGNNTIEFWNGTGWAPDIDTLTVG
ncbi:MAG: family 16 glycosylhydrolase [Rhodoglobus sp.]